MLIKRIYIIFLLSLIVSKLNAQLLMKNSDVNFEIGYGNTPYENINSEQYLFFINIQNLNSNYKSLSFTTNLNVEYIKISSVETYLFGLVPMFRFDTNLFDHDVFIRAGVGVNFVNKHKIGPRNIGSHFIFSDMISVGTRFFQSSNYAVEFSYLFRHISNAGLFNRNQGYNSQYLMISFII